ncbi:hypothetical protein EYF80_025811 [Liparis tanakae]|uniref:Uncharacterized protein n=1 Tax=Liparis tanakae TaxID=230148 RepID=A0A4Z2HDP0_9TELE|nr:hypothetical protein EYF80_025811 [Liparis tanakae]
MKVTFQGQDGSWMMGFPEQRSKQEVEKEEIQEAGHIQMDNASLQAVHHTVAMVMGQEVPHDGRGEVTETVGNDVRLQRLQKHALSHRVLHQLSIQLVEHQLTSHQSLGDIPSSCQRFEMSAAIDQLHLLQVQSLQNLLTGPVHDLQLFMAVHENQLEVLSRYQEEVDCISFTESQDGVDRLLNRNKLPGQLRNTGRVGLSKKMHSGPKPDKTWHKNTNVDKIVCDCARVCPSTRTCPLANPQSIREQSWLMLRAETAPNSAPVALVPRQSRRA